MHFKEWIHLNEDAGAPGAKQSLYPMGYGGIGLYPPSDVITWASDAITYMPEKVRFIKFIWGDGILGNPFRKDSLYSRVENKIGKQIQAGDLEAYGKRFEKTSNYIKKTPLEAIHAGSLKKDDDGFAKDTFIQTAKNTSPAWDYSNIGGLTPDVQLLLHTKE